MRTSLYCLLGLTLAAAVSGCKMRGADSDVLAAETVARNLDGRHCFFGSSMNSIQRLNYLSTGYRYELTAGNADQWRGRPAWLQPAIVEGMRVITGDSYADAEAALRRADDQTIWYQNVVNHLDAQRFPIRPVTQGGSSARSRFYQFEVSLGDNWNGFVIQVDHAATAGTADVPFAVVATYSDGDTADCSIARPTAAQRVNAVVPDRLCAFGTDTNYLENSMSRRNGVWQRAGNRVALTAQSRLTAVQTNELRLGMTMYDEGDGETSVQDMINSTDDQEVGYQEIRYRNRDTYRLYTYYGGDNQVGFIFGPGTNQPRPVAVIGDSDIGTCMVRKTRR